jgi:hypothetical protein
LQRGWRDWDVKYNQFDRLFAEDVFGSFQGEISNADYPFGLKRFDCGAQMFTTSLEQLLLLTCG